MSQPLARRSLSTPQSLKLFVAAVWVATLAFWAITHSILADTRAAVKLIGKDSVPAILASQEIRARLSNANANAANGTLTTGNFNQQAWKDYDADMAVAMDKLVTASQKITFGDEERVPILRILNAIPHFAACTQSARDKYGSESLTQMKTASEIMRAEILPAADDLDKVNFAHLDSAFAEAQNECSGRCASICGWGALALGVLVWIQIFVIRRFRRIINPFLVTATAAIFAALVWSLSVMSGTFYALREAKESAFDSIHVLSHARAIAFDANADESLWLLESWDEEFETHFRENIHRLARTVKFRTKEPNPKVLEGTVFDPPLEWEFQAAIRQLSTSSTDAQGAIHPNFTGLIADELKNICFEGEARTVKGILKWFDAYLIVDRNIRRLEREGKHAEAVAMCVGTKQDESNWAFDAFDKAMQDTIQINKTHFGEAINGALSSFETLNYLLPILALGAAIAATIGLLQRVREFS